MKRRFHLTINSNSSPYFKTRVSQLEKIGSPPSKNWGPINNALELSLNILLTGTAIVPSIQTEPLEKEKDMSTQTHLNAHTDHKPSPFLHLFVVKPTVLSSLRRTRHLTKSNIRNLQLLLQQQRSQFVQSRHRNPMYLTESLRRSCIQPSGFSKLEPESALLTNCWSLQNGSITSATETCSKLQTATQ